MIYHISDLHQRKDKDNNKICNEHLKALRAAITPQDLVIATGDLTDDGREDQYENLLEVLEPFRGQLLVVLGNHDAGTIGNFYNEECYRRFNKLKEHFNYVIPADHIGLMRKLTLYKHGNYRILLLDTVMHTQYPHAAKGTVGKKQLKYIKTAANFCKKLNYTSVVAMHHSPFDTSGFTKLIDADKLKDATVGNIDFVLVGHEHKYRYYQYPERNGILQSEKPLTTYISAPAMLDENTVPLIVE